MPQGRYAHLLHSESNLYYRTDTSDLGIIKELISESFGYGQIFPYCKGKIVLDAGCNIGAFSNYALRAGASQVYGFEPEPENIEMIKRQPFFADERFTLYERAIGNEDGVQSLYTNLKSNKGCHSLMKFQGRTPIDVKVISFAKVMQRIEPEVLKMDIESFELYLKDFGMVKNLDAIAIEMHFAREGELERATKMLNFLKKNFEEISNEKCSAVNMKRWGRLAIFIGVKK